MSSSHQSFQFSNQTAIEEALGLSQQKSLIIQKYMQKLSSQQNKIQELVSQIQRLNWQNRQKQYREQYTKKHCLQDLIKEGFAEQVQLSQGKITNNSQQGTNQQNKQIQQENKRYILRIIVNSDLQQIQLTQKMQLLKSSQSELLLHQNQSINNTSFTQLQSYCQQVMSQVQQMKLKLQRGSQKKISETNGQQYKQLKIQNENSKENYDQDNHTDELRIKEEQLSKTSQQYLKQITRLKEQIEKYKSHYERQIDIKSRDYQEDKKNIKEELQRLTSDISQLKIQHQSQIANLKHQNVELKNQIGELKHQIGELKHQIGELKHQNVELKNQISELKHQIGQLKHQIGQLKHQIGELKHQIGQLKHQIGELKHQNGELQNSQSEQLKNLTSKCQQISQSINNHQQQLTNPKTSNIQQLKKLKVSQSESQINSIKHNKIQLQQQLRQNNVQLTNKILQLQKNQQLLKLNYENQLTIRTHNFQQELRNKQNVLSAMDQQIKTLSTQINQQRQMNVRIVQFNTRIAQFNTRIAQFNTRIAQLDAQIQQLNLQNIQLTTQVKQLGQKVENEMNKCEQKDEIIKNLELKYVQINGKYNQTQRQLAKNSRFIVQTADTQCQTDPQLLFGSNLRISRGQHHFSKAHNTYGKEQKSKIISLPPPSLERIGFDFDNSLSSEAINLSNISRTRKQMFSNLSSSSFSKNEKNIEQVLPNVLRIGIIQEPKYCSLQNIKIPSMTQAKFPIKNQLLSLRDISGSFYQTKTKSKSKIIACSQKNIIVQDPNQDQQHNQTRIKSKKFFQEQLQYQRSQSVSGEQRQLIPSRSALTSSASDKDIKDPIKDRDLQLQNSDNPSQTYKNSLRQMTHKSDSDSNQSLQYMYRSKQSNKFGKDSMTSNSKNQLLANKATQLLQLKTPEHVMKSLIEKSFPIQKNPFKLSYEYLNLAQILKSDDEKSNLHNSQIPKKSQNGSESLSNIVIETQNSKLPTDKCQHSNVITALDNKEEVSNGLGIIEELFSQKREGNDSSKVKDSDKSAFKSQAKKADQIQLANSLDFGSIKKIDKPKNETKSSSKKKHKIIYLRR